MEKKTQKTHLEQVVDCLSCNETTIAKNMPNIWRRNEIAREKLINSGVVWSPLVRYPGTVLLDAYHKTLRKEKTAFCLREKNIIKQQLLAYYNKTTEAPESNVSALVTTFAMSSWRQYRKLYVLDDSSIKQISKQFVRPDKIPLSFWEDLPETSFAICHQNATLGGYQLSPFRFLIITIGLHGTDKFTPSLTGAIQTPDSCELQGILPIDLNKEDLVESVSSSAYLGQVPTEKLASFATLYYFMINTILFLVSQKNKTQTITNTYNKKERPADNKKQKTTSNKQINIRHLSYRFGDDVPSIIKTNSTTTNTPSHTKHCPHVCSAHYRSYLTGKGSKTDPSKGQWVIRKIASHLRGTNNPEDLITTIHKVKNDEN